MSRPMLEPGARQYLDSLEEVAPSAHRQMVQRVMGDDVDPTRIDTVGTARFFEEELEEALETAIEAKTPPQNIFQLFDLNTSVSDGAQTYTQTIRDAVGQAAIINETGQEIPRVDTVKKKISRDIVNVADRYSWSVFEVMAARFAGEDLDTSLGAAARRAIEELHNHLGWWGSEPDSIWGVLKHPRIPRFLFSNSIDSNTNGDVIVAELVDFAGAVEDLTKTTATVDTLVLPPKEYRHIRNREISAGSGVSILDWIVDETEGGISTVEKAWELDAGEGQNPSDQPYALAYNSSSNQEYVAPIPFRQMPAERNGLEFEVPNIGRSGGFYTHYPLEICVGELTRS